MALNFFGIGISFGVKDKKLSEGLDSIAKKFEGVYGAFNKLAQGARAMGAKVSSGLKSIGGVGRRALGGLAGALDNMSRKALDPRIDNAFSKMFATFHKAWGEITLGMGLTSKASNKWRRVIGSAAYALNVDMGEAAKSWASFRKQGVRLDKFLGTKGMTSTMKTLIKLINTMGIDSNQLALMVSGLTRGFKFTEQRAAKLIDVVFRMGKQFGVGKDIVQEMPGVLDSVGKELAIFFKGSPEEMEAFTKGIVKVAIVMKQTLGVDIKKAVASASGIFTTLTKNWQGVAKAMIGEDGNPISAFMKRMVETRGDFSKVLALFRKDPAKFMNEMASMSDNLKKQFKEDSPVFLRFQQSIKEALGADALFTIKAGAKATGKIMGQLNKVSKTGSKGMENILKETNRAFKTGLTRGESYRRMLDSMHASFDKLTDPMVIKWLKNQKKGMKELHHQVEKLVKDKGPLGELARRLFLVQRVGLSGLFMGMGATGTMAGKMLQGLGPALATLTHMGLLLGMIGKLLLPGGIILIGLALFDKSIREKLVGAVKKAFDWLKIQIPKMWPTIQAGLEVAWKKAILLGRWITKAATWMMNGLAKAIDAVDWELIADKVLSFIGNVIRGVSIAVIALAIGLWESIFGAAEKVDVTSPTLVGKFEAAGEKLGWAVARAFGDVIKTALINYGKFFFDWSDDFGYAMASKATLLGGLIVIGLVIKPTRAIIARMLWFAAKWTVIWTLKIVGVILFAAAKMAWFVVTSAAKLAWLLVQMTAWAIRMAAKWLVAMGPVGWAIAAIASVGVALYVLRDDIKGWARSVSGYFKSTWDSLVESVSRASDSQKKEMGSVLKTSLAVFDKVSHGAATSYQSVVDSGIAAANEQIKTSAKGANRTIRHWNKSSGTVSGLFGGIRNVAKTVWTNVANYARGAAQQTIKYQMASTQQTKEGLGAIERMKASLLGLSKQWNAGEIAAGQYHLKVKASQERLNKLNVIQLKWRLKLEKIGKKIGLSEEARRAAQLDLTKAINRNLKVTAHFKRFAPKAVRERAEEARIGSTAEGRIKRLIRHRIERLTRAHYAQLGYRSLTDVPSATLRRQKRIIRRRVMSGRSTGRGVAQLIPTGKKITGKPITGPTSTVFGDPKPAVKGVPTPTGAGMVKRKKEQVSMSISEDTKTVMGNVATKIEELASAIQTFKVNIVFQGDIGRFLKLKSGQERVAWKSRGTRQMTQGAGGGTVTG